MAIRLTILNCRDPRAHADVWKAQPGSWLISRQNGSEVPSSPISAGSGTISWAGLGIVTPNVAHTQADRTH
jgi:hypothetical protein